MAANDGSAAAKVGAAGEPKSEPALASPPESPTVLKRSTSMHGVVVNVVPSEAGMWLLHKLGGRGLGDASFWTQFLFLFFFPHLTTHPPPSLPSSLV